MKRRTGKNRRLGAAIVEFAIAAPILFLFVFALIEFSRVNIIRNTVENAAYEGARAGILPGATAENCAAVAQELLDFIQVVDSTITVDPEIILPESEDVTVTVEVPITMENGYITPKFYLGKTLRASITLPRETSGVIKKGKSK